VLTSTQRMQRMWHARDPPGTEKKPTKVAKTSAASKLWRDEENKFTLRGGIVKSSFIEFNIRRTRKSPALRFNIGQSIQLVRGAMVFHATVYSFTPHSLSGSAICASGILRLQHQSEIQWEIINNSI
jgi:hypothetical protein